MPPSKRSIPSLNGPNSESFFEYLAYVTHELHQNGKFVFQFNLLHCTDKASIYTPYTVGSFPRPNQPRAPAGVGFFFEAARFVPWSHSPRRRFRSCRLSPYQDISISIFSATIRCNANSRTVSTSYTVIVLSFPTATKIPAAITGIINTGWCVSRLPRESPRYDLRKEPPS